MKQILIFSWLLALNAWAFQSLTAQSKAPYQLPALPYAYAALEPYIDAQTMEIHHSKHHAGYVTNLNKAIQGTRYEQLPLDEILLYAASAPDAVRNNAGGHYNHSLFWNILTPNGSYNAGSEVGQAIQQTFGGLDSLKVKLNQAAATRFGSGWAWLSVTPSGKLIVSSTPNQDNPIMNAVPDRGIPILGIDVWEHAYYLKYQNRRGDYLAAIWQVLNWEAVNKNYLEARKSPFLRDIAVTAWSELNTFHKVMSQTFHPAEEGNLQPILSRSGEMAEKAKMLAASTIPTPLPQAELQPILKQLSDEAAALHKMISGKKPNQEKVKTSLVALHDRFHQVMEKCDH